MDPTCGQEFYLVHLVNGQYRIKLSKDPSVPSIALQTSFPCPQHLRVVLQLISQRNEFCAVLLCTFIQPPPKSLGNCWPISNKFSSKASTCATSKLFENNINKSSSLPGCRSLLHIREPTEVVLQVLGQEVGRKKEKYSPSHCLLMAFHPLVLCWN